MLVYSTKAILKPLAAIPHGTFKDLLIQVNFVSVAKYFLCMFLKCFSGIKFLSSPSVLDIRISTAKYNTIRPDSFRLPVLIVALRRCAWA